MCGRYHGRGKSWSGLAGEILTAPACRLTRRADLPLARLYRELVEARRRLGATEVSEVAFDEDARWLVARRGEYELVANFAVGESRIPVRGGRVELVAGGEPHLDAGYITLPGMAAALIR